MQNGSELTAMTPPIEKPLLILYGCSELSRPLREHGMATSTVRRLGQILRPKEDLQARAILIGPNETKGLPATEVIPQLRDRWPMVDVVVWLPKASGPLVRDLLNAGAKDVLLTNSVATCAREVVKLVHAQQLLPRAALLGEQTSDRNEFEGMYSRSQTMWDLFDTATRVSTSEATVLILGETGTGKELLARAIHKHSGRSGRFVPLNCGAIDESLINSELFGHVEGTFTGATKDKLGLFRHADGGTLFLDEIGNIPLAVQYHLLRALQEEAVRPVGGHEEIKVDVRVIAATSDALESHVQSGKFREDLFYRLDVMRLELPPLRDRPEDIVFLFAHFSRKLAEDYNVTRPDLTEDFLDALVAYHWPGNVRQLQNFSERLVLTHCGERVNKSDFEELVPDQNLRGDVPKPAVRVRHPSPQNGLDEIVKTTKSLQENLAAVEQAYLERCLEETQGLMAEAAKIAGISRRTLLRKMKSHKLDKADYRTQDDAHIESHNDIMD